MHARRGIDAPESAMPYGKEAKEALLKLVQGKRLKVYVYDEDRYGRCVGDIYCDGIFVQVGLDLQILFFENLPLRWNIRAKCFFVCLLCFLGS